MTESLVGVAHRTLPCGTRITFKNPSNGRIVTAPVVDRGPYVGGRQWDLTGGLCLKLGHCYTGSLVLEVRAPADPRRVTRPVRAVPSRPARARSRRTRRPDSRCSRRGSTLRADALPARRPAGTTTCGTPAASVVPSPRSVGLDGRALARPDAQLERVAGRVLPDLRRVDPMPVRALARGEQVEDRAGARSLTAVGRGAPRLGVPAAFRVPATGRGAR